MTDGGSLVDVLIGMVASLMWFHHESITFMRHQCDVDVRCNDS